jgi:hypothetical protein
MRKKGKDESRPGYARAVCMSNTFLFRMTHHLKRVDGDVIT